ncbi:MAG: hypothetical protein ACREOI_07770 [bacterium]
MAVVKGVKEKVHLPLYDSIVVKAKEQLSKTQSSNILRFFQDVAGKTKLQTNMQAASLLPHWNTFEARAMRVVISDLTAQFPDAQITLKLGVINNLGQPVLTVPTQTDSPQKTVDLGKFKLSHLVQFKRLLENPAAAPIRLSQDKVIDLELTEQDSLLGANEFVEISLTALRRATDQFGKSVLPPNEQIFPNNGFGSLIGKFIYNSVTTFFVGEKAMIQVPTWFFPGGAGPFSEDGKVTTHGEPTPEATFRFAEPIFIDTQQNFRVEIEIPESEVLSELQRVYGPFFIWIVLDGYMTRDVQ